MASRFLLVLLLSTYFSMFAYTAAPPVNVATDQPSEPIIDALPKSASTLQNAALLNDSITFKIPGTPTSLIFSRFSRLISQSELDLCVIEGIGSIFELVLSKGKDGVLPLNSVVYKYGNVVINVDDFSAPSFRMTYASLVPTLRGIALFTSLFGYYAASFDVFDSKKGHVGTGDFGPILSDPDLHGGASEA